MIERRCPENVDSDCAMDCSSPMSAKTSRKIGSREPDLGGDVQPGLVHQRQQAQRPQRDRLAAGVRPGDDERRVAVAQPEVDGDHPPGQPRVAGREQHDLRPVGERGPDAVQLRGQLGLGGPEVELGERLEGLAQEQPVGGDQRRELVEDPLLLLADGRLGLSPRIAQLHDHERLNEQRLPAARGVVDDALDATRASARIGTT